MKNNMCVGCDYKRDNVPQEEYTNGRLSGNLTYKKYCLYYQLHLEYVERIHEGGEICPHYFKYD